MIVPTTVRIPALTPRIPEATFTIPLPNLLRLR
jgi:hypothetical protein